MLKRTFDWLDERSGYRAVVSAALDEEVPGGSSFAYVFGSVLSFILILQMTTGVFLAMYYSTGDPWASVAYIQDQVTMGWFIRGLHSHGASAMVIVSGLHLLQTALYGAYKKPRELNWIIGVLLLGLILAFALTGYLLPWDQTGYWATKVATGIAGTTPFVGEQVQQVAQGGNEYGNLTLTRFFAIHVFVLPAAMLGMVAFHIALFRKHGVTPKWGQSAEALRKKSQPFWPDQLFKDMVAVGVAFAALAVFTVWTHGVKLDAPADPSSNFDARPEWYFRALFQLLKYFEGVMETIVSLGLPVVVGGVLLAIPFLDRGEERNPLKRLRYLVPIIAIFAGAGILTAISVREDAGDKALQERIAAAKQQSTKARALAKQYGVPPGGGVSVFTTEPGYRARMLWAQHCASCHDEGVDRKGPLIGAGYNSRQWIRGFLMEPNGARYFGPTKIRGMDPVEHRGEDLRALVEFVYAQTGASDVDGALASRGKTLFDDGDCSDCHEADATSDSSPGPNLGGRGNREYLMDLIEHAGDDRFFGQKNEMPTFRRTLTDRDRAALADWLILLRTASS